MARMASKIAPKALKDCSKRPPRAQDPPRSAQEVPKGPPRAPKGSPRAPQDPKIQTAGLEFRVHRVGSAGTAKRIQSAAHLPVCIGVLDHDPRHCGPDYGSQIPLGMLPLPSLGPPRGATLLFGAPTEGQVHAVSMHVPCSFHRTFSVKMASRALKMPSRRSKSPPRAIKMRSRRFKSPSTGSKCKLEQFYIDVGV